MRIVQTLTPCSNDCIRKQLLWVDIRTSPGTVRLCFAWHSLLRRAPNSLRIFVSVKMPRRRWKYVTKVYDRKAPRPRSSAADVHRWVNGGRKRSDFAVTRRNNWNIMIIVSLSRARRVPIVFSRYTGVRAANINNNNNHNDDERLWPVECYGIV